MNRNKEYLMASQQSLEPLSQTSVIAKVQTKLLNGNLLTYCSKKITKAFDIRLLFEPLWINIMLTSWCKNIEKEKNYIKDDFLGFSERSDVCIERQWFYESFVKFEIELKLFTSFKFLLLCSQFSFVKSNRPVENGLKCYLVFRG